MTLIPVGSPLLFTPTNSTPTVRWSGKSLAKAQTAWRNLSPSVIDSVLSALSDSMSSSRRQE